MREELRKGRPIGALSPPLCQTGQTSWEEQSPPLSPGRSSKHRAELAAFPPWHGRCLSWARAAQIPPNPVATCIISPNIARNKPAIHGSNQSCVTCASVGPAWTPAFSRELWGLGGIQGTGPHPTLERGPGTSQGWGRRERGRAGRQADRAICCGLHLFSGVPCRSRIAFVSL